MKNAKFLVISLIFALAIPVFVSAATTADIQAQIQSLMAQIKQLQAQLAQLQGQSTVWCHDFNVNLRVGDSGSEVQALIAALNSDKGTSIEVNMASTEFTEEFASMVTAFQQKYKDEILTPWGLKYGTGFVGKTTRAKLNKLYGCGTTVPSCSPAIANTWQNICSSLNKQCGIWPYCGSTISCGQCTYPQTCDSQGRCTATTSTPTPTPTTPISTSTSVITVLSPNAPMATYTAGETYEIRVLCKNITKVLNIFLVDERTPPSSRRIMLQWVTCKNTKTEYEWTTYNWTIPLDITSDDRKFVFRIRAETLDSLIGDESDYSFSIDRPLPRINVFSPNGGETLTIGATSTIKWTSTLKWAWASRLDISDISVKLDVYGIDGYYKGTIGDAWDTGSFVWTVGEVTTIWGQKIILPAGQYIIRICDSGKTICDDSDRSFSIVAAGFGLNDLTNQLADISQAVSKLIEKVTNLIGR